ncbi:hypothetical protein E2562_002339 [Oryza meyeriana var. granulata]|uniref:Uncharacterized protein n=1 Tax=Oryza meyeriana var. granulata TaxID=110450 RepID=A0A6G1BIG3_9ORYZ|nr:hypothetical protein E2562_002339 [Oryza meyeriana var. granulata]
MKCTSGATTTPSDQVRPEATIELSREESRSTGWRATLSSSAGLDQPNLAAVVVAYRRAPPPLSLPPC